MLTALFPSGDFVLSHATTILVVPAAALLLYEALRNSMTSIRDGKFDEIKLEDGNRGLKPSPTNGLHYPTSPLRDHNPSHTAASTLQDDVEKLNSQYQLAWSEVMAKGPYSTSTIYNNVHVLLLSWDEDYDSLGVKDEVNRLGEVFEKTFRFDVKFERLKPHEHKTTQAYINMFIANWVWKNDSPHSLLIVYFAAHGRKGAKNIYAFQGKLVPGDYRAHLNQVVWSRTEEILRDTQSDVLEIIDSCYAGSLLQTRGCNDTLEPRAFECLAAAGADFRTPGPGKKSFTAALIWSLEKLAKTAQPRHFTTSDLFKTIRKEAPDFQKEQKPIHYRADEDGSELIVLAPLPIDYKPDSKRSSSAIDPMTERPASTQAILTLKFVFGERPAVTDITKLGDAINLVVAREKLIVSRIIWGGLNARTRDSIIHTAALHWKTQTMRRLSKPESSQLFPVARQALTELGQVHEEVGQVHDEVGQIHREMSAHSVRYHDEPPKKRQRPEGD